MSHYLSMVPSQQMKLEQRLTPQLIQSMEILQLPLLALEARIQEELISNPVLEESAPVRSESDDAPTESATTSEQDQAAADSFERLDEMSRDLEFDPGDLAYGSGRVVSGERDAKMDAMANTASRGENLTEYLLNQWHLLELSPEIAEAGEVIIEWMDEDGYLRRESEVHPSATNGNGNATVSELRPLIIKRDDESRDRLLEEISLSRTPPIDREILDEALEVVQTLEPIGVGACDLTEALLIQLENTDEHDPLCEELVKHHLVELGKNMFPQVAKKTGREIDDIKDALRVIGRLRHHPGHAVGGADAPRIAPDVIVDYDESDGYTVRMARGSTPRLRISAQYREMLRDKMQDKSAREFLKQRLDAAGALIDAIQFRRDRLLELAKLVVDRQRDFFDYGPQFIKVLRMSDVAEEFGCDPSTISRTVDGKYIQSPRGIHPLRMFFTGGTTDASGEEVSWDSIKAKVQQIIDDEDKANPLSDEDIAKRLSADGTTVARRTVAKYRSQLNIPSARQRREF